MKSMSFVDPNQFVITRRRKKYKFALFNNSPLCFECDEWRLRPIDVLEVGAGTGLFSVELAARHPEQRLLGGIDIVACRCGGGIGVVFGKTQPVGKARARVVKRVSGFQAAFGMTFAALGAA